MSQQKSIIAKKEESKSKNKTNKIIKDEENEEQDEEKKQLIGLNDPSLKLLYQIGINEKLLTKGIVSKTDIEELCTNILAQLDEENLTIKDFGPLLVGLSRIRNKRLKNICDEIIGLLQMKYNETKNKKKLEELKKDKEKTTNKKQKGGKNMDLLSMFQNHDLTSQVSSTMNVMSLHSNKDLFSEVTQSINKSIALSTPSKNSQINSKNKLFLSDSKQANSRELFRESIYGNSNLQSDLIANSFEKNPFDFSVSIDELNKNKAKTNKKKTTKKNQDINIEGDKENEKYLNDNSFFDFIRGSNQKDSTSKNLNNDNQSNNLSNIDLDLINNELNQPNNFDLQSDFLSSEKKIKPAKLNELIYDRVSQIIIDKTKSKNTKNSPNKKSKILRNFKLDEDDEMNIDFGTIINEKKEDETKLEKTESKDNQIPDLSGFQDLNSENYDEKIEEIKQQYFEQNYNIFFENKILKDSHLMDLLSEIEQIQNNPQKKENTDNEELNSKYPMNSLCNYSNLPNQLLNDLNSLALNKDDFEGTNFKEKFDEIHKEDEENPEQNPLNELLNQNSEHSEHFNDEINNNNEMNEMDFNNEQKILTNNNVKELFAELNNKIFINNTKKINLVNLAENLKKNKSPEEFSELFYNLLQLGQKGNIEIIQKNPFKNNDIIIYQGDNDYIDNPNENESF